MSVRAHIKAVVAHLNAGNLTDPLSGVQIVFGDGKKPDSAGWQGTAGQSPFHPYAIVWRIGAKDAVPESLNDDLLSEARPLIYIRYFGATTDQVEDALDLGHQRLIGSPLSVPGRRIIDRWLDNGQTTTKSENTEVSLYEAGNFYRLWTEPE